ncbi:NADH-cytochrome b5 reductase-like isoform X2 [Colius striatus]|uniref:NADH-cytochrome b5 reductase-like isoform X2 n=1 Tax=Colius striatus TaxID=57412 RepID=UPI002B1D1426|nr:NADH-cytochrome b5 reductase-like isoform X2 [Colius striatus]
MSGNEQDWLALRPQEPSPSQCCGSGCKPCIYDVYEKELAQWERAKAKQDKSLLVEKKEQSNNSELNPDRFSAFSLDSVEQLTEDTYQYKFELPGNSSLGLSLGQHIVLRGVVDGLEVQRAYTPISPGNAEGYFEVLIKCYEAGLMSQYIKTWKKGDMVFWRGPFGGFPYRPNQHGELLMLVAGTGLAPMLPILRAITEDEEDETFVTLVGCFRTFDKIYLKPLLQDLARYWNIRIFYVLSQETSLEKLPWSYQENTHTGRLNEDLLKTIINSCRRRPFVLICGSSTFNEDMSRYLKAAALLKITHLDRLSSLCVDFHQPLDQIFVSRMILALENLVPFQSGCYAVCHPHLREQHSLVMEVFTCSFKGDGSYGY